jgi:hypothetical protein
MELKGWRDKVREYDQSPATKLISNEDKMRFMFLAFGDDVALHRDKKYLTMANLKELRDSGGLQITEAKKEEIKEEAQRVTSEFREDERQRKKQEG